LRIFSLLSYEGFFEAIFHPWLRDGWSSDSGCQGTEFRTEHGPTLSTPYTSPDVGISKCEWCFSTSGQVPLYLV